MDSSYLNEKTPFIVKEVGRIKNDQSKLEKYRFKADFGRTPETPQIVKKSIPAIN